MFRGDFLYEMMSDKRVVYVGYDIKNIWENGQITTEQKIVAKYFLLDAGDAPVELRVSLPYTDDIVERLNGVSGAIVGRVEDVFDGIDIKGIYSYEGSLKSSYIGFNADKFSPEIVLD